GVYETALSYGFEYKSDFEKLLILKMLSASLSGGEDYERRNREVDELLLSPKREPESGELEKQIEVTSSAFAMDMLLLKFIQGLPIVGVVGGAANPVYYKKIMDYVELKYRKRYLMGKKGF
ncbi:MAG TPA: EcsC family protein, partial [Candidatus Limivicinus faecipullorum]|nr:EcsC family protein [Candidatus Limivicinus faecipullorum]